MNQYENIEEGEFRRRFSIKVCDLGPIPLYLHYSFFLIFILPFVPSLEMGALNFPFLISVFLLIASFFHGAAKYIYLLSCQTVLDSAIMYPFGTYFASPSEKTLVPNSFAGIACCLILPAFYFFVLPANSNFSTLLLQDLSYAFIFVSAANLVPTFPSDSAFFLNNLLAKFKFDNSFKLSSVTGQVISSLLLTAAVFYGSILTAIYAVLTLISSISRYVHSQLELASDKYKLSDIATSFEDILCFQHGITVRAANTQAKDSSQTSFPVFHGDEVIGIVHKEPLSHYSSTSTEDVYISEVMDRDFPKAFMNSSIVEAAKLLKPFSWNAIIVIDNEEAKGIIFEESIAELMSNPTKVK